MFTISIHYHSFQFLGDLKCNDFSLRHPFFRWGDGQPRCCSLNGEASPVKSASLLFSKASVFPLR